MTDRCLARGKLRLKRSLVNSHNSGYKLLLNLPTCLHRIKKAKQSIKEAKYNKVQDASCFDLILVEISFKRM